MFVGCGMKSETLVYTNLYNVAKLTLMVVQLVTLLFVPQLDSSQGSFSNPIATYGGNVLCINKGSLSEYPVKISILLHN